MSVLHPSASKALQRATLSFLRVYNVHGSHRHALGLFIVCRRVAYHVFEENFENCKCFFINET